MPADVFVDTNVFIYARDGSEPVKQPRAAAWITALDHAGRLTVSSQIVHEFISVSLRRFPDDAPEILSSRVEALLGWRDAPFDADATLLALDMMRTERISWWDALVVAAATLANCAYIVSEDFSHGRRFGRIEIVDPFRAEPQQLASSH